MEHLCMCLHAVATRMWSSSFLMEEWIQIMPTPKINPLHYTLLPTWAAKMWFNSSWIEELNQTRQISTQELHYTMLHGKATRLWCSFSWTEGLTLNNAESTTWIPLHSAAQYDHKDVVQLLLERGADPNRVDSAGRTALYKTDIYRRTDIANILWANGGN